MRLDEWNFIGTSMIFDSQVDRADQYFQHTDKARLCDDPIEFLPDLLEHDIENLQIRLNNFCPETVLSNLRAYSDTWRS